MKFKLTASAFTVALGLFAFNAHAQESINTVGSAAILSDGTIQLTNQRGQAGAAWLSNPLSTSTSFSAQFSFSLASPYYDPQYGYAYDVMADGISFALQNQGNNVVGVNGGAVGYTGLNGVGSIIRTYYNNNVGLDTTGNAANANYFADAFLGYAGLVTGTETVSYDVSSNVLSMVGTLNVDGSQFAISDSATINLFDRFGTNIYAGFTGGTGDSYSDQRITNYSVTQELPEPAPLALLGLGLFGLIVSRRKSANSKNA